MELQDGFVGIFNDCDGRCEICPLTSRCRAFANRTELEAQVDPALNALADAAQLPEDIPPSRPLWMHELIEEVNKLASEPISDEELERCSRRILPERNSIRAFPTPGRSSGRGSTSPTKR